jgi:hypothetical protein
MPTLRPKEPQTGTLWPCKCGANHWELIPHTWTLKCLKCGQIHRVPEKQ